MTGCIRIIFALLLSAYVGVICSPTVQAHTVSYYRFEEGTGTDLLDSVSNTVGGTTNATFSDSVAVNPIPLTGASNAHSLQFAGSQAATFTNDFIFHSSYGDATLEFWLNAPNQAHSSVFWTRTDNDDSNRFNIYVNPDGVFGFDYRTPDGTLRNISEFEFDVNTWTHIAITRTIDSPTQHTYRSYRDGVLVDTAMDINPDLPTVTGWTISGRSFYELDALVDEVRFSNVAIQPSAFLNAPAPGALFTTLLGVVPGVTLLLRRRRK